MTVAEEPPETALPIIGKVAELDPSEITTLGGTVTALVEEANATSTPPAPAEPVRVAVPTLD
jgi:hypothetical protein